MSLSLITITLNSKEHLPSALSSVGKQLNSNFEHIIIDGASDDGTVEIIKRYQNESSYPVLFLSEKDGGLYDALNKGISLCSNEIIGILHSDDEFYDDQVISGVINKFSMENSIDVLIGNVVYVNAKNPNWISRFYKSTRFKPWMFRFGFMPSHTGAFIKKSIFERVGYYDSSFVSAGDFDFFLRVFFKEGVNIVFIDQIITKMRLGGISSSGLNSYLRTSSEILKSLSKNNIYSNWLLVLSRLPIKFLKLFYERSF